MITFKQFLEEGFLASLFHGTTVSNAYGITMTDILRANAAPNHLGGMRGHVSLTRNMDFAKGWGKVVFELDQEKLRNNYKVKPYNFFASSDHVGKTRHPQVKKWVFLNQYEEAVIGDIRNVSKYIKTVHLPDSYENYKVDTRLNFLTKNYNINYYKDLDY